MSNARNQDLFSSAIAGGTTARAGGSSLHWGVPDMACRTASFPIYRGNLR